MPIITMPYYIDFITWSRTLYVDLPDLNIPVVFSEDDWDEWAFRMIEENQLTTVPLPSNFTNWRDWAEYFINNTQNTS